MAFRLGPARAGGSSSSDRVRSMIPSARPFVLVRDIGGRTLGGRALGGRALGGRLLDARALGRLLGESSSSDERTMTALRFNTGVGDRETFGAGSGPFALIHASEPYLPSAVCHSPSSSMTTSSTSSSTRCWIALKYLISHVGRRLTHPP